MSGKEEGEAASPEGAPAASKIPLLLALVNSLVVLGALGFLAYTKLAFKRPPITEETERARITQMRASPKAPVPAAYLKFDAMTVNIASTPQQPKPAEGTSSQIQGKLHYLTVAFTLEIREGDKKDEIESLRPLITDRFISVLGRKTFQQITNPQGRYVLRNQLIDIANQAISDAMRKKLSSPWVSNILFTQFVVQ